MYTIQGGKDRLIQFDPRKAIRGVADPLKCVTVLVLPRRRVMSEFSWGWGVMVQEVK
jgi:hypothetical protein